MLKIEVTTTPFSNQPLWRPILDPSGRRWPRGSNDPCMGCHCRFDTVPCCIPVPRCTPGDVLHVHGNFCSWNCAKGYLLKNKDLVYKHITLLGLLCFITSHRPLHGCIPSRHDENCQCLSTSMNIRPNLKNYKIKSYEWITTYLGNRPVQIYAKIPSRTGESKKYIEPPKVTAFGIRKKPKKFF